MRHAILTAIALASVALPARAQQSSARDSVRRAALDYLEGFYEGDSSKIVRSVRPDVRKVGYYTNQGSTVYVAEDMPYAEFLSYVRNFRARGRSTAATAPREVIVGE